MPSLTAFGRRWHVGTDDFVFPGILDSTVKSCWLIAALVIFLQSDSDRMCANVYYMRIYFYVMIIMLTLTILTDVSLLKKSMTGSMMDQEARKLVVPLIYIRLLWEAIDVGWNVVGTIWAYGDILKCIEVDAPTELAFIKRFVICNWMSLGFLCFFACYLFDPLGRDHLSKVKSQGDYTAFEIPITGRSHFWENRCRRLCCFFSFGNSSEETIKKDGFHEVGKLIANLVQDYNLLPSDIFAGLIAMHNRSKGQILFNSQSSTFKKPKHYQESKIIVNQPKIELNTPPPVKRNFEFSDEIKTLNHYFQYINGLNGWQGFFADDRNRNKNSFRNVWNRIICCGCLKRQDDKNISGDNCCFCNTAILRESVISKQVKEEDLIYVSFLNDYYQVPFYIIVDHAAKSFTIVLRGTFSGKDVITDLTAWPVPINLPGLSEKFRVHHGILLSAQNVKDKIETLRLLDNVRSIYPEYKLVIIGQSLGAAVGTVLGMLMKSEFPELKVYAFSPPGGLLNLEASIWTEDFTLSIVYGYDIIARISLASLENFRAKLIDTIRDCKTPKFQLLMGYCSCFCNISPNVRFRSQDEKLSAEAHVQIDTKFNHKKSNVSICPMYAPGKILHITERSQKDSEFDCRYEIKWAEREDFLEILPSPRMYNDHWPFRMLSAFREFLQDSDSVGMDNETFVPC